PRFPHAGDDDPARRFQAQRTGGHERAVQPLLQAMHGAGLDVENPPGQGQQLPGRERAPLELPLVHIRVRVSRCAQCTRFRLWYTEPMDSESVASLIREGIPGALVRVASDDNIHFEALVVAEAFNGLRAAARHRLVYRALG